MESIGALVRGMAEHRTLAGTPRGADRSSGSLALDSGPRPDPVCPQCGGKGYWVRDTGQVVQSRRRNPETKLDEVVEVPYCTNVACLCLTASASPVRQSADAAGLLGVLAGTMLSDFDGSEMRADDWRAVQSWAAGLPGSLSDHAGWLFAGTTGNGKTLLAAGLLNTVRRAGVRVRFTEETALVRDIQATYSHDAHRDRSEDEGRIMAGLIAVPLLCLDDLGQASIPGYADAREGATWLASKIYALLNGRTMAGKPTIITSNLKPAALAQRLGDGATSRLDALRLVRFTGRDRR